MRCLGALIPSTRSVCQEELQAKESNAKGPVPDIDFGDSEEEDDPGASTAQHEAQQRPAGRSAWSSGCWNSGACLMERCGYAPARGQQMPARRHLRSSSTNPHRLAVNMDDLFGDDDEDEGPSAPTEEDRAFIDDSGVRPEQRVDFEDGDDEQVRPITFATLFGMSSTVAHIYQDLQSCLFQLHPASGPAT